MIGLDFTMTKYIELCRLIQERYEIVTVRDYLAEKSRRDWRTVLRHDVDRFPKSALAMAKMENEMGISATYYFRFPFTFKRSVVDKIASMGHEIGYHYECVAKANGNLEESISLFDKELGAFRSAGYTVRTISAHGGSLKYDNNSLWDRYDFCDYGILGDAYLSLLKDANIVYFSDTGRSWSKAAAKTLSKQAYASVHTTDDLLDLVRGAGFASCCFSVHPERWASTSPQLLRSYILDFGFNCVKTWLARRRRFATTRCNTPTKRET